MRTSIKLYLLSIIALTAPALYAGVNPDGSFSYSLPIEIPAGRNGLQPQLALTYNSNSPNGIAGLGFALQGLPAITRMNYGNGINYGKAGFAADTFAGPDGRLIDVSGNGTVFHGETESWVKYEVTSNACSGPCSWKATDRNGVHFFYGLTGNSRIVAKDANNNDINNGAIRVWALEKVQDLNGNYYEVSYKKDAGMFYDNGQYYPEKISYTLGNGVSKNYAVSFFYDETGRPDKEISYAQSAYVKTNWRLTRIAVDYQNTCFLVFTCGDRVRSYELRYENSADVRVSRVTTWQQYNSDNVLLPPLELRYEQDPEGSFTKMTNSFNITDTHLFHSDGTVGSLFGDFNGDGKTDILRWTDYGNGNVLYLSAGDGSFVNAAAAFNIQEILQHSNRTVTSIVADFNGDGKSDILRCWDNQSLNALFLSNGDGSFTKSQAFNIFDTHIIHSDGTVGALFGDFNGDGKIDILRWTDYGNGNMLYLSAGDGSFINATATFNNHELFQHSNRTVGSTIADFNGDGKADILRWWDTYSQNALFISNGDGSFTKATSTFNVLDYHIMHSDGSVGSLFGDFNGDGKTDILRWTDSPTGNTLYLSTGDGSFLKATNTFNIGESLQHSNRTVGSIVGDFNGDGRADILRWWDVPTSNTVFMSNGDGSFTKTASTFNITEYLQHSNGTVGSVAGDFDGNARTDILRWWNTQTQNALFFSGQTSKTRNLLVAIVNPIGSRVDLTYVASNQDGKTRCPFPASCSSPDGTSLQTISGIPNASPRYLVTQVTTTSNMDLDGVAGNDTQITKYEYYNGRMTNGFVHERASLGFEKIRTIDQNSGNYQIDTYRQDKPFQGRLKKTATYLSSGAKVSETIYASLAQYYCNESGCSYNAAPVPIPTQPQQIRPKIAAELAGGESAVTVATNIENGIAYVAKEEEVLAYDIYGNPTAARQTVTGNSLTKSTYKFIQYVNDLGAVRTIGLPFNEKICLTATACATNDTNFVSEYNAYFDGQGTTGIIGTRKLVTKKETFLSTGAAAGVWVPEIFTYDSAGNLTQKVDAQGVTTTVTYDSDYKQFPLIVTKTHNSTASVTTYEYDPRFGKKTLETTHDDGNVTLHEIDASGFVTQQQTQNGSTILAKKRFAHSPLGTSPLWTQECTYYGTSFTQQACRKKFTDALGRVYREEYPELVNGSETTRAIERRFVQTTTQRSEYVSQPQDIAFNFSADFATLSFPGKWRRTVSDNLGRQVSSLTFDNKSTSTAYINAGTGSLPAGSVACTVTTDVDGTQKRNCSDISGKPSLVTEAHSGAQATEVSYLYDALNRMIGVTSPQGTTTITYIGRSSLQESIIDPVVGTTSYEYFLTPGQADFMKLKKETRPATTSGTVVTDLEYNAAFGRISKSSKTDSVTNYVYDETDVSFGKGKLTTLSHVVDGYTIQERYSYNSRGETTNTTRRLSHATETLCSNINAMPCLQTYGSTKDELGRVKTMTYPDGKITTINYVPGSTKNVQSIIHDATTCASYSDYSYDIAAHVGKITYGNGVEHNYTYNAAGSTNADNPPGLLNSVTIGLPAQNAYMDLDLTYYPTLNIKRISDNVIPILSVAYTYDALNRLSLATWDPDGHEITRTKTYQFDNHPGANSKGNLTRKDQRRLTYAAGKTYPVSDELWNESTLSWQANTTYSWSGNGNLIGKGPYTFSYDSNNMLKQAVEVDGSSAVVGDTKFFYDQSGQRFLKKHTRGGVTIKTWYLGDGIELREKYVGVTAGTPDGTYDSSQTTKYIYGIDNKKLASITGNVFTAALTVTSSSMLALADSYSSSTAGGIASKAFYTFYGAYAYVSGKARELTTGQMRIIALAILALLLGSWLLLTHPMALRKLIPQPLLLQREGEHKSPLSLQERGLGGEFNLWQRATALGMVFAFFTVNCGSQLPAGVTQGQVDTAISELYTGLPTGTVYYSHNHLGSGTLVTDSAGNEVFRITYTEYGEIDLVRSGKFNPATGLIEHDVEDAKILITAVKYTGQEYDPETGLYYYNARYYDPQLGVFTSGDDRVPGQDDKVRTSRTPLNKNTSDYFPADEQKYKAVAQAFNRHMYVAGNPINYADPTGHEYSYPGVGTVNKEPYDWSLSSLTLPPWYVFAGPTNRASPYGPETGLTDLDDHAKWHDRQAQWNVLNPWELAGQSFDQRMSTLGADEGFLLGNSFRLATGMNQIENLGRAYDKSFDYLQAKGWGNHFGTKLVAGLMGFGLGAFYILSDMLTLGFALGLFIPNMIFTGLYTMITQPKKFFNALSDGVKTFGQDAANTVRQLSFKNLTNPKEWKVPEGEGHFKNWSKPWKWCFSWRGC